MVIVIKALETPKNIKAKGSSSDYNVPTTDISAVETNISFVFNLNNSQSVYKQISSLFTKHFEWTHLSGRHVLSRWQGIMGFLVFSPPRYAVAVLDTLCLSSMQCGCLRYAVPVLDTLCLSAIFCACPKYAVPVLNTLSWRFAVPVPIRNCILTLIPLYAWFSIEHA